MSILPMSILRTVVGRELGHSHRVARWMQHSTATDDTLSHGRGISSILDSERNRRSSGCLLRC